ncbi:MAG TPA: VWA domain-containing protein [Candidatus Omnitrophota bacterium]|nr:VWA domain-containing protein [Candidatus Omnitrophota bacterium]
MHFARPDFLYIVILGSTLIIIFLVISFRQRTRALQLFADKALLGELLKGVSFRRKKIKAFLLAGAVIFSLCALLRPQWGFQWHEIKRRGLAIMIALDTSRSMLARDVLPSRLDRSKLAIKDFVGKLSGDRLGLVAFAGSAFVVCPLTNDYGGFLLALDDTDTSSIPRGGTAIVSAIREAMRAYRSQPSEHKILILITDGEDHEEDPLAIARQAKKEGITIYCIGIGTREGDLIAVENQNERSYVKDSSGNVVKSRLNEDILQKIALATGGVYIRSTSTEFGLELLYKEKFAGFERQEFQGLLHKRYSERFQILLVLAVVCILIEVFISENK